MLQKLLATGMAFLCFSMSYSQGTDSTKKAADTVATPPPVTITGSVDVYYRYNFDNAPGYAHSNNFTSFTNSHNSFELGMATIRADHSFGKASVTADLGFGRRAEEFSYGNPDHPTLFAVKQLYLSYAVTNQFKLTMGKWATHIGYEVLDAYLNRNYSMDYMFSYGPFSHTGIKADIGLGGKSALMIGVANPSDSASTLVSPKFVIAQFSTGTSNGKLKAYLNFQDGSNGSNTKLIQGDLVLTYTLTDKFNIGYNGTVQARKVIDPNTGDYGSSNSWWGSALYFNVDPTSVFGLTLRGEYFDDKKNVLGFNSSIFDATLSLNFKVGNLTIIPELRLDNSSEEIFEKNDGTGTKSTFTGLLAATYHF